MSTRRPGNPTGEASALLAITETAATAIKSLTASQAARGGRRPDRRPRGRRRRHARCLKLSVVDGPAEDDQVVDEHGAHVFLEPHAASYRDDKLLDAEIDGQQVRFAVSDQR
jgi:iron-sulfur cluster assembly protein